MIQAPEPGLHDVDDETYHRWHGAINQSLLKKVRELTPAHAKHWLEDPDEQTYAQGLGEAFHVAALQPDQWEDRVIGGLGIDRRSNANKAAWAAYEEAQQGKIILPDHDLEKLDRMIAAVRRNEGAMQKLDAPGRNEVAFTWRDEETGLLCKGKVDGLRWWNNWSTVLEAKTTRVRCTEKNLQKEIGDWGYDVQAAFYLDGLNTLEPANRRWFWVFVESGVQKIKTPQFHSCRVVEADAVQLHEGRWKYKRALRQWAKALESGEYPEWGNEAIQVGLRPWDQVSEREANEEYDDGE